MFEGLKRWWKRVTCEHRCFRGMNQEVPECVDCEISLYEWNKKLLEQYKEKHCRCKCDN